MSYKGLFGTARVVEEFNPGLLAAGPMCDNNHVAMLVAPVSNVEIKEALWAMGDDKAPGPDGFNAKFYKASWDLTGPEVCAAVKEFFRNGHFLKQFNHTIVSLIPKVEEPLRVDQYRPISCCNVIYKVISKVLTNRLGKCLGTVINSAQSAFVGGRLMSDNIFLVQELLRRYNVKRDAKRCFLNVDLAKAYDTVDWKFLEAALIHLGILVVFVRWVMECVETASYSIKLNTGIHGYFEGKRGLRQGDPLSPLLFVICMEMLSRMLVKETANSVFHFHQHCKALKLSHLIFADDIVFFCRGDAGSVGVLMKCLKDFERMSGLSVNVGKSAIFTASVSDAEHDLLVSATGFQVGAFPFRYLGIPINPHGLRAIDYNTLLDKVCSNLNVWAKKLISFAGRREMIVTVLQGKGGFWLSILPVPQVVIGRLVALCRGFLWRRPRVRWKNVCVPRVEGGLGLLDLVTWNRSFMMKHYFHVLSSRDSLWVRWVHHRYLAVVEPRDWAPQRTDSPLIKAIIQARDLIPENQASHEEVLKGWCKGGKFRVSMAYDELRGKMPKVRWEKEVWAKHNTPKHMFILWLANLGKLSTYDRLIFLDVEPDCRLCGAELETHEHLFFDCPMVRDIWGEVRVRFLIPSTVTSIGRALRWLRRNARGDGCLERARVFALSSTVYFVWRMRNAKLFDGRTMPMEVVTKLIITHVFQLFHVLFTPTVVGMI